ncbi:MAG: 30S ribosomal protein S8 [Gammaproteobacteria bacterium]|nr:30S ribosomal protein S8 [Gammaproteobacteria bacterium]NIN61806.1 30S ribosomal protein S8 [Gammaproteobacteria bacterium]NIO63548.1 30S ribosomal protein S8 [Gammaproteobacteria bacterium]NIP49349.1 30S ribosomal protein S8 [Gammaproteobacteria bacterium]NIQ10573.1 30S ribosomal protein S8 [Gammaproteobacteria bacterium]
MSMQDPISDMLCQIRNGQARAKISVVMPSSKLKVSIAEILKQEGYIIGYQVQENNNKPTLSIDLKYFEGKPVIEKLLRVSKPSLRSYKSYDNIPKVLGGFGTAIISTSKGVMTDKSARAEGIGGEVLCIVA